jgi:hypothetical protein
MGDLPPRLFIVHAPEDEDFVGHLLHALALPEEEVLLSSNYELGALILEEIERGARSSVTLAVVSPAMMASPMLRFAEQVAQLLNLEGGEAARTRLVPLVLEECELRRGCARSSGWIFAIAIWRTGSAAWRGCAGRSIRARWWSSSRIGRRRARIRA